MQRQQHFLTPNGEVVPPGRIGAVLVGVAATSAVLTGGRQRRDAPSRPQARCCDDWWLADVDASTHTIFWSRLRLDGGAHVVLARESHSALFDAARRQIVVFGGCAIRAQMTQQLFDADDSAAWFDPPTPRMLGRGRGWVEGVGGLGGC